MNWADERYVRLFTRDTDDWLELSWKAQGLMAMLLRKVDRAGFIEAKRAAKSVANIIRWPVDVVEEALPELIADGMLVQVKHGYLFRNFIDAQEATKSEKLRAKEYRERERDRKLGRVTERDAGVTESDVIVTPHHTPSHVVTPYRAVPCRTQPGNDSRVSLAAQLADVAVREINRHAGTKYQSDSKQTLIDCKALAKEEITEHDVAAVVASKTDWLKSDKMRRQFKPKVLLRPSKFAEYLEDIQAGNASTRTNGRSRIVAPDTDEVLIDGNRHTVPSNGAVS